MVPPQERELLAFPNLFCQTNMSSCLMSIVGPPHSSKLFSFIDYFLSIFANTACVPTWYHCHLWRDVALIWSAAIYGSRWLDTDTWQTLPEYNCVFFHFLKQDNNTSQTRQTRPVTISQWTLSLSRRFQFTTCSASDHNWQTLCTQ